MDCSIIVPVYKGQQTLPELIERLGKVLPGVAKAYEVLLVDDGSPDGSWEVIRRLAQEREWVRGINLLRNYGQHNATLCGVRAARYAVIVTMDDDLQHPPEEIPHLLTKLEEGYDVVYGIPRRQPHNWWRNGFSTFTKAVLSSVMGIRTVRDIGSFRAFRAHLRQAFENFDSPELILDVLLSWGTTRFASVPVEQSPRSNGASNYNFRKLAQMAFMVLTGFSTAPLRLASIIGFVFTLLGVAAFLYVVIVYFTAGSIPGFPFLASIISLFSGAQLFALGIIGEYLARVFDRTAARPCYAICETTGERHE
jgi:undecaprenyl-phosphate 4-deoxy-4-formamido-L-arabinose transferase